MANLFPLPTVAGTLDEIDTKIRELVDGAKEYERTLSALAGRPALPPATWNYVNSQYGQLQAWLENVQRLTNERTTIEETLASRTRKLATMEQKVKELDYVPPKYDDRSQRFRKAALALLLKDPVGRKLLENPEGTDLGWMKSIVDKSLQAQILDANLKLADANCKNVEQKTLLTSRRDQNSRIKELEVENQNQFQSYLEEIRQLKKSYRDEQEKTRSATTKELNEAKQSHEGLQSLETFKTKVLEMMGIQLPPDTTLDTILNRIQHQVNARNGRISHLESINKGLYDQIAKTHQEHVTQHIEILQERVCELEGEMDLNIRESNDQDSVHLNNIQKLEESLEFAQLESNSWQQHHSSLQTHFEYEQMESNSWHIQFTNLQKSLDNYADAQQALNESQVQRHQALRAKHKTEIAKESSIFCENFAKSVANLPKEHEETDRFKDVHDNLRNLQGNMKKVNRRLGLAYAELDRHENFLDSSPQRLAKLKIAKRKAPLQSNNSESIHEQVLSDLAFQMVRFMMDATGFWSWCTGDWIDDIVARLLKSKPLPPKVENFATLKLRIEMPHHYSPESRVLLPESTLTAKSIFLYWQLWNHRGIKDLAECFEVVNQLHKSLESCIDQRIIKICLWAIDSYIHFINDLQLEKDSLSLGHQALFTLSIINLYQRITDLWPGSWGHIHSKILNPLQTMSNFLQRNCPLSFSLYLAFTFCRTEPILELTNDNTQYSTWISQHPLSKKLTSRFSSNLLFYENMHFFTNKTCKYLLIIKYGETCSVTLLSKKDITYRLSLDTPLDMTDKFDLNRKASACLGISMLTILAIPGHEQKFWDMYMSQHIKYPKLDMTAFEGLLNNDS